jgi:hypothetical protein
VPYHSSAPLDVDGMVLQRGTQMRFLLANFTPHPQRVRVGGCGETATARHLDESSVQRAVLSPDQWRAEQGGQLEVRHGVLEVELAPYALVRIDTHHE